MCMYLYLDLFYLDRMCVESYIYVVINIFEGFFVCLFLEYIIFFVNSFNKYVCFWIGIFT